MNDKTSEAGLLYCVRAVERVQRVLLHPGPQQENKHEFLSRKPLRSLHLCGEK
jgi:hypothetical protein